MEICYLCKDFYLLCSQQAPLNMNKYVGLLSFLRKKTKTKKQADVEIFFVVIIPRRSDTRIIICFSTCPDTVINGFTVLRLIPDIEFLFRKEGLYPLPLFFLFFAVVFPVLI